MTRTHFEGRRAAVWLRLALCSAVLACGATSAAAQSCLGAPGAPRRHSLGLMFSSPGAMGEADEGAIGMSFGMTSASAQSMRIEISNRGLVHDNAASSVEDFTVTRIAGTLGRPLGKAKTSGTATSGWCGIGQFATAITRSYSSEDELGRAPSPASTAYSAAAGAAWAISTPRAALYAGPLFGFSSANEETAPFTTLHVGASIRLGGLLLNGEVNAPIGSEGSKSTFDIRTGWAW